MQSGGDARSARPELRGYLERGGRPGAGLEARPLRPSSCAPPPPGSSPRSHPPPTPPRPLPGPAPPPPPPPPPSLSSSPAAPGSSWRLGESRRQRLPDKPGRNSYRITPRLAASRASGSPRLRAVAAPGTRLCKPQGSFIFLLPLFPFSTSSPLSATSFLPLLSFFFVLIF